MKQGPVTDERLPAVWDTMVNAGIIGKNSSSTNGTADMNLDLTQLPLVSTASGEKVRNTTDTLILRLIVSKLLMLIRNVLLCPAGAESFLVGRT